MKISELPLKIPFVTWFSIPLIRYALFWCTFIIRGNTAHNRSINIAQGHLFIAFTRKYYF